MAFKDPFSLKVKLNLKKAYQSSSFPNAVIICFQPRHFFSTGAVAAIIVQKGKVLRANLLRICQRQR